MDGGTFILVRTIMEKLDASIHSTRTTILEDRCPILKLTLLESMFRHFFGKNLRCLLQLVAEFNQLILKISQQQITDFQK